MKESEKQKLIYDQLGIRHSKDGKYCLCNYNFNCPKECNNYDTLHFDDMIFINDDDNIFDKIVINSILETESEKVLRLKKLFQCPVCKKYHYYNFCTTNPDNKCLKHCYNDHSNSCRTCKYHVLYFFLRNFIDKIINPKKLKSKSFVEKEDTLINFLDQKIKELIYLAFLPIGTQKIESKDILKILISLIFKDFLNYFDGDGVQKIFRNAQKYCKILIFLNYFSDIFKVRLNQKYRRRKKCFECTYFQNTNIQKVFSNFFSEMYTCIKNKLCLHKTVLYKFYFNDNLYINRLLTYAEEEILIPDTKSDCTIEDCPFDSNVLKSQKCDPDCFFNFIMEGLLSKLINFGFIFYGNEEGIGSYWDPIKYLKHSTLKKIHFIFNPLRLFWHNSKHYTYIIPPLLRTEPYYLRNFNGNTIYRGYFQNLFFPLDISDISKELRFVFNGINLFQNLIGVNQDKLSKRVAASSFENFENEQIIEQLLNKNRNFLSIVDLGCGSGNFLGNFLKKIIKKYSSVGKTIVFDIYLIDLDPFAIDGGEAKRNIIRLIQDYPNIRYDFHPFLYDFLRENCFRALEKVKNKKNRNFDIIFVNQVLDMYSEIDLDLRPRKGLSYLAVIEEIEAIFRYLDVNVKISEFRDDKLENIVDDVEKRKKIIKDLKAVFKKNINYKTILNTFNYQVFRKHPEIKYNFSEYKRLLHKDELLTQDWVYPKVLKYAMQSNVLTISDRIINNDKIRQSKYFSQFLKSKNEIPPLSNLNNKVAIKSNGTTLFNLNFSIIKKKYLV